MRVVSKVTYWVLGCAGIAVWTGTMISLTNLPLPAQLVLGSMALVVCVWGHAVLFPRERPAGEFVAPGRMSREQAMEAAAAAARPVGSARIPVSRPARQMPPPGDLPPLLRTPFEEAARMEAHRLAEAITAVGLFGPVNVRLEADGTALVSPVQASEGVRVPIATVVRFASYAVQADGLAPNALHPQGRAGAGTWPGRDLQAAMDAHLAAMEPPATGLAPVPAPQRFAEAPPPGWANPLGHLGRQV